MKKLTLFGITCYAVVSIASIKVLLTAVILISILSVLLLINAKARSAGYSSEYEEEQAIPNAVSADWVGGSEDVMVDFAGALEGRGVY